MPRTQLSTTLLGLSLATLLCLSGCASNGGPKEMTDEQKLGFHLENALRFYDLRDLDRAQDQALRGLAIDPDNARFLLILGRCHLLRDTVEDITAAEEIFREHPDQDDYRIRLCLGETLERKGVLYDESGRQIEAGLRYTDAPDPEERGRELRAEARKFWKEAVEQFEESNELYSGGLEALNGLMRAYTYLGQDDDSIRCAGELIDSLQESNAVLRVRLREEEDSESDSLPTYRAIAANQDLEVQVRLHVSNLHHRAGRDRAALAELDRVIEVDPDLPELYSRRGQLYFELGEFVRAKESIQRYLRLTDAPFEDPSVRRAYDLITKCDAALRDDDA